jgi:antitoxin PrlF
MSTHSKQHKHTSKITRRNQTTLPASVCKARGVNGVDTFENVIQADRVVLLTYKEPEHSDQVVPAFLKFIESDMMTQPSYLQPITKKWISDLDKLVRHTDVDLNEPI